MQSNIMLVKRTNDTIKLPNQHHYGDLGYDIWPLENTRLGSLSVTPVRTGLRVQLPDGYGALIKERSSLSKQGVFTVAGIIDGGYRGEIIVFLFNSSRISAFDLGKEKAFAQLIPIYLTNFSVLNAETLSHTARGEKGFGSTSD